MSLQACRRSLVLGSLVPLVALGFAACFSQSDQTLEEGRSALTVNLTASNAKTLKVRGQELTQVIVHLTKVTAHSSQAGWVTLSDTPIAVDLLKLQDSASALGVGNLPAGKVTQLRLYVDAAGDNHVVTADGTSVPLKVPSGSESGIKIKGPFDLSSCEASEIDLDFDCPNSIKLHPVQQGEVYFLRPVIRIKHHRHQAAHCTPATDGGVVSGGDAGDVGDDAGDDHGDDDTHGKHGRGHEKHWGGQCGNPCSSGDACYSGHCGGAKSCDPSSPGAPCESDNDCASVVCSDDGECTAPSAPAGDGGTTPTAPGAGTTPPGTACSAPSECLSQSCEDGTCQTGGQGAPCQFYTQCDNGLTCDSGFCVPALN